MRNWASYVTAAREHAGLTRTQLAHAVDTSYATIWRWETGKQTPERSDVIRRFVEATGVDLDEALTAAGLRPHGDSEVHRPAHQDPPLDARLRLLRDHLADPDTDDDERRLIEAQLEHLTEVARRLRAARRGES